MSMSLRIRRSVISLAGLCLALIAWMTGLAGAAHAQPTAPTAPTAATVAAPSEALPPATGTVILEVRGRIGRRNGADAARLDAAALRALPQKQVTTAMPWYDTRQTFSGPTLQAVLELAQARGERLRLIALNDYSVDIPLSDLVRYQPVLAHQLNGKALSVRDKGPLFLVYPFDQHPEIKNDVYYGRSIWQVATIVVY
jgi:hypothetical protein